ncbi:MFS transporter [Nocardia sp. NPDC050717]|uniref:MFS transporter n=1 Tax=Nocardia sp. NPDC050717 TaxID=3157221 RepID=UPI0033D0AA77
MTTGEPESAERRAVGTAARREPEARTTRRQWGRVGVLWTVTFTTVTSQTLLIGLLTPMAAGLGSDPGTIGYAVTVTSLVTAVVAPLVSRVLGTRDRTRVVAVALVLLGLGNAITAAAPDFATLALGRLVLGVAIAVVWALAGVVAGRLVADGDGPLALSIAVSGIAAAAVVGVPLGTLVGDLLGWRSAYALVSVVALVLVFAVLAAFPALPGAGNAGPARALRERGRARVVVGLAAITFLVAAQFAAYTYVRAILEDDAGFGPTAVALALSAYGILGIAGNFAAGALAARWARHTITGITVGVLISVALLALGSSAVAVVVPALLLWGFTYGGLSAGGQIWLTRSEPDRAEQVTGLYVGTFNASVALGSFAGGAVLESTGTTTLLWFATGLAATALAILPWAPNPARPAAGT